MNLQSSHMNSCFHSSCFFKARPTILVTVYILITITSSVIVTNITKLDNMVITKIIMAMMAKVPFLGDLSSRFRSIFSTRTAIMLGFIVVISSPSILVRFEKTLLCTFSNFSMWIKFICILSATHILLVWRAPSNSIITLVSILTLLPIKLTFNWVFKWRFVNMVKQFPKINKCAKMSIIEITVTKIRSILSNSELDAPDCRITNWIALFYGILFIRKTLNSISINLVT